ncbi:MAG: ribokinase [Clostridia bacterium]|nr:ribokinase [Clostridia bacterium]
MGKVVVVGSFITDIAVYTPRFPVDGESVIGERMKFGPGGKGSNQATAAHRAGAEVTMVTKLGGDFMAEIALNHYKNEKMDMKYVYRDNECETGSAVIEIHKETAENRIIVTTAANEKITREEVFAAEKEFAECDVVLLQHETSPESLAAAIDLGNKYNKKIILNTAPMREVDRSLFAKVDFVTPNETEAEYYSGVKVTDLESARKAAAVFKEMGAKNVLITLGKAGAYVKAGDIDEIVPPFTVKAVDTTGAGDAFNGGFAAALSEGKDIISAVKFASALAAVSVTRPGTSPAMPYREEIDAFLAERA